MKIKKFLIILFLFLSTTMVLYCSQVMAVESYNEYYYDDFTEECSKGIYYNTENDYQELAIVYEFGTEKIIRGVEFKYNTTSDNGNYELDVDLVGDMGIISENWIIPADINQGWIRGYFDTTSYLIYDDPILFLSSPNVSTECIFIGVDTPSTGNSAFYCGGEWEIENSGEYMCDLIVEDITELSESQESGEFTSSDNLDYYSMNLEKDIEYNFTMEISGGCDFDLRLYSDLELITDTNFIAESDSTTSTEKITFTPTTTGEYFLLAFAYEEFVDVGTYTLVNEWDEPLVEEEAPENSTDWNLVAKISGSAATALSAIYGIVKVCKKKI